MRRAFAAFGLGVLTNLFSCVGSVSALADASTLDDADSGTIDAGSLHDAGAERADAGGERGDAGVEPADGSVVLVGSGFGSKVRAAPLRFLTFDDVADGAPLNDPALALVTLNEPALVPAVSKARAHSGANALRMIYPVGPGGAFPGTGVWLPQGSVDLYYANWVYWEWTQGSTHVGLIFKWARAGAGEPYRGVPRFYNTVSPHADGEIASDSGDTGYVTAARGVVDHDHSNGCARDGWHFVEYKYRLSTPPGASNGRLQMMVDGVPQANLTAQVTRDADSTATLDWMMTVFDGNDSYGASNEYRLYADEMLIDNSFARVVLTDSASYANSTRFAPQPASEWSPTSIEIRTPNWSNFAASSMGYFHVFDADDQHVAAFARRVPAH